MVLELDSANFNVRDQAVRDLKQCGHEAELELRRALTRANSVEFRRRAELLLAAMEQKHIAPLTGEILRRLRMVQVLEYARVVETQTMLGALAKGAPSSRVTRAAQAALIRLGDQERQKE